MPHAAQTVKEVKAGKSRADHNDIEIFDPAVVRPFRLSRPHMNSLLLKIRVRLQGRPSAVVMKLTEEFPRTRNRKRYRWIPMVHGAGEVLVEGERHDARFTQAAIDKADAVRLDEPRR